MTGSVAGCSPSIFAGNGGDATFATEWRNS